MRIADVPLENPHRFVSEAHYRLYVGSDGDPTVICVQDFDYRDYDDRRFLSTDSFESEEAGELGLNELLSAQFSSPTFAEDARAGTALAAVDMPLTRAQYLAAFLSAVPLPAVDD